MDTPDNRSERKHAQSEKPCSSVEMWPLCEIKRSFGDLLGIVHVESSHTKLIFSGWKVCVMRNPISRRLVPILVESFEYVTEADPLLGPQQHNPVVKLEFSRFRA